MQSLEGAAGELLRTGQAHERAGRVSEAAECYAAASERAAQDDDPRVLSESLRCRGVLYHLQAQAERARSLCCRAYDIAIVAELNDHAAEALNALAGFELERGRLAEARQQYQAALEFVRETPGLIGKIEQNLGVVATIRGDWDAARSHYLAALAGYEKAQDFRGCAIAYHNLGRVHAERKEWDLAEQRYHLARKLARLAGDIHQVGMSLLGHAEVYVALAQYDDARATATEALGIFRQIDAERDRAGAHRLLGAAFRGLGESEAAEQALATAIEIAQRADCPLEEADAIREMARLRWAHHHVEEALALLSRARELFARLDAAKDVANVDALAEAIAAPACDARRDHAAA
jgi:tetratricopeptide (TPR) repeat protein